MADQDKDGLTQGPLSGATTTGYGDIGSGTAQSAGTSGGIGASASQMAGKAAETVKEGSARIAGEAKQYVGDMTNLAKEKSRTMFQQQKDSAVGQVDSVAHAIRSTATNLEVEGQAQIGRYIGLLADQLETFGSRLRDKDLDTLIADTQNLARRSPGAFFAGTVVTGFLLSRFLKSSSERRQISMQTTDDDLLYASDMQSDAFSDLSDVRGAGAADMAGTTTGNPGVGTSGTALGTGGTGTLPSTYGTTGTGGNSHDNR